MTKTMRFGREALLWTGGVLGSLCLFVLAAGWLFNVTPLVFSSASMSPAYEAGALGVAYKVPATDLEVGDVVSVINAQGDRVTHRIVGLTGTGEAAVLTLKGDTNNVPDAEAYNVTSVDRVSFGVPYAGYVLNAAASPFGLLVVALLVGSSLWLGFGRREDSDAAASRRTRVVVPVGITGVVLAGTVLGASGQAPWAFTSAYWTDTATVTATASVPSGVTFAGPVTCAQAGSAINLTWTNVNAGYEYFWQVQDTSGNPTVGEPSPPSGTTGSAVAQGGTVTVAIAPGGSGNRTWQVAVYAQLEGQPGTRGAPVIKPVWRIQPGGNRMSCTAT